jgi:hypothetical protein
VRSTALLFPFPIAKAAAVQFAVRTRALVPSHFYRTKVLAWQCSLCCKLFSRPLEELERDGETNIPIYIKREFRMHNCDVALVSRQERRDAERNVRVTDDFWETLRRDDPTTWRGER